MSSSVSEHPTDAALAAFALGQLAQADAIEVGHHLVRCAACRAVLDRLPGETLVGPPPGATPPAAGSPVALPQELCNHPRYQVVQRLGQGGMGTVYRAEHRLMERPVIIKVINRSLVDSLDAVERFNREVRAAAKLDHPNIVKAYDAEQAGGLQFLAMEYVEGKNLADVLAKKGPLSIPHACHYVRQAALGLQHAHERGMVHRDVKPQNLMLTPKGVVKILDFGLAKLASERRLQGLTAANVAMGTPPYVAPEQALDAATADVRADIYSLGCTLFELLTGRPPFVGEQPLDVILAHVNDPPPPLEKLRSDVPTALAELVARMLAKRPEDRPQTPKEVAESLLQFTRASAKPAISNVMPASAAAGSRFESVTDTLSATPAVKLPRRWLAPAAVATGVMLIAAVVATVIWVNVPAGYVRVEVPDGAEVRVDGEVITAKPYRITVDKADRKLIVTKDGVEIHSESLSLKDKGRAITVALVPQPPAPEVAIKPPPGPAPEPKEQPVSAVLAPEKSEWAGTGGAKANNARWPQAAALTVTERRGQEFKGLLRINGTKLVVEGAIADDGKMTVKVAQVIAAGGGPLDHLTGGGDVTKNRLTLRLRNPDNGNSYAYDLKRLPDAGAGFRFPGRWMCYDQPTGWRGLRAVNADGTLYQGRDKHHWTRDGGLIHISFGQWLAIDPDDPGELKGGGGNLTVRWVRQ